MPEKYQTRALMSKCTRVHVI